MIPGEVATQYERIRPAVQSVEEYVGATLRPWSEQRKFIFTARKKDLGSLAEKLESGRYEDWVKIDDLFACTVVVPTAASISHECL